MNWLSIFKLTDLFGDLMNALLILAPLVGGCMITYHYVMKSAAQDEQAASQHARSIRTILISVVAAMGMAGVIKLVTTTYVGVSNSSDCLKDPTRKECTTK